MGPGRPHLLSGEHPDIAVTNSAGGQRGQVGSGALLTDQLTPLLLVAHDRREMTETLFLGPEGEPRGGRIVEAERIEPAEIKRTEHFVQHPSLCRRQIETEVAPWP